MRRVGKNYEGKVAYISEEELRALKESGGTYNGTNQQKAKVRKMVNRLDKN